MCPDDEVMINYAKNVRYMNVALLITVMGGRHDTMIHPSATLISQTTFIMLGFPYYYWTDSVWA